MKRKTTAPQKTAETTETINTAKPAKTTELQEKSATRKQKRTSKKAAETIPKTVPKTRTVKPVEEIICEPRKSDFIDDTDREDIAIPNELPDYIPGIDYFQQLIGFMEERKPNGEYAHSYQEISEVTGFRLGQLFEVRELAGLGPRRHQKESKTR